MSPWVIILLVVLAFLLFGTAPQWGWHDRGYWPSGGLGLVLIIVVVLILFGRL